MQQMRVLGFLLLLAGSILLAVETDSAELQSFLSWPFILFIAGTFLVFFSFLQKQSQLTLIGGICAAIGLTVWGFQHVENWPTHWSLLVIMLGIILFLQYILNRSHMTLLISIVILLSGFFAWPGLGEISFFEPIADMMNQYWPIFIVALGAFFIFVRTKPQEKGTRKLNGDKKK